ncbi:MAG: UDP-N-acetylglucosamine pyrophosphorylase [Clostridia bacterium]|nr:UDP-N-acetylglucosamine pyrophosphorylase [Clostridia bacterium]NCC74831.1 UDP-N-acetylglucosamine pyrophosphorylase [Clostridia bacterium]
MKTSELQVKNLFDLSQTMAAPWLELVQYPWEILPKIKAMVLELGARLPKSDYEQIAETIWVAKDALIAPSAALNGPLIIGHETEVRHCAYIRGSVLIGQGCVVGNSTELKNVILMNQVQVPHYNYVGDSVLGFKSHMGAGSITSNVKSDKSLVTVRVGDEKLDTGLKKFGAILGDKVEIGCNSVLNPGSIVGRSSHVYPLSMVRGVVPPNSIYKTAGEIVTRVIL